jgi:hypothetical protein
LVCHCFVDGERSAPAAGGEMRGVSLIRGISCT